MSKFANILETVGNTPVVKIGKLAPAGVDLYVKIEATSGNTGIGLAMVCAQKGYPLVVTMAETFSVERRKLMRFLGAKVVLTPAADRGLGMVNKAVELAQRTRRDALEPPTGAEGGHLRRHHRRRHLRRGPAGLQGCAQGLGGAVHAARYRRALPEYAAVRRHPGGHDRR
jgi:hypothetical protein